MRLRPRILPVILALLLVLGCGRREMVEESKTRWMKLRHRPLKEARVGTDATVHAEIEASQTVTEVNLYLYYKAGAHPQEVLEMKKLEPGKYFATIPSQKRGTLVEYYVEARAGTDLVVRVPREEKAPGFTFYYKGTPNRILLTVHIVLMFASLAILILAGYLAFKALKDRQVVLRIPRLAFLGTVLFFISSFPLGMVVAYQTYGKPWTGFPIGTDITDNKSLAIVLYFAAATFFYRGSVFKKDPTTDLLPMKPLPYIYLVGVLLTIIMFLIPH